MNWPERPTDQSIGSQNVADAAHEPSAAPVRASMSRPDIRGPSVSHRFKFFSLHSCLLYCNTGRRRVSI